ncbi:MAG: hypothetical protein ACTTGJ_00840 [Clostridium sp.]
MENWDEILQVKNKEINKEKSVNENIIEILEKILENEKIIIDKQTDINNVYIGAMAGIAFTKKIYTNILQTIKTEGLTDTCTCNSPNCTCSIVGKKTEEEILKEKTIISKVVDNIKIKEKLYGINDKKIIIKREDIDSYIKENTEILKKLDINVLEDKYGIY